MYNLFFRYIVLYNSLGNSRIELIKVIVTSSSVIVKDSNENIVPCQINPVFKKRKMYDTEFEVSANAFELFLIIVCVPSVDAYLKHQIDAV